MSKFLELKAKIFDFVKNNKSKTYTYLGIISLLIAFFALYINSPNNGINLSRISNFGIFSSFEVSGANFDLGIKKLPYNVKTIDITFSKDLKGESITKDIFKISPEIPGTLKLKNANTISYELSEKLNIGQDYTITVSKNLLSNKDENLASDIVYIISAVPGAKVVSVLPNEKLEDISKNMVLFFSIPQVPLTSLDEKDKLPCPLIITPKIEGKCKWTTTSVVEFIPTKTFVGATKYDFEVKYMSGMNYELEENFTGSFVTPDLNINLADTFLPKNYINLDFNFPVSIEEINKNLILLDNSSTGNILKYKIEPVGVSESSFLIEPISGEFYYDTNYEIKIKSGLKPKYGNIALKENFSKNVTSSSLVSQIEKYQNVFSNTGALIDTKYIDNNYLYLPNKNVFFRIDFNEEVALDKNLFLFQDDKKQNLKFDISYLKEEIEKDDKKQIIENKKIIKLELTDSLLNNKKYDLTISKKANKYMQNDIVYNYETSPELQVMDYKFIDYSKSCVYLNNSINDYDGSRGYINEGSDIKNYFSFSNSGVIKSIYDGDYIEISLEGLSREEKNKKLIENGYCPEAGTGQILYAVQTRLNPNTSYKFEIKGLVDKYSNILKTDFAKEVKTGNIKEKDKYVYTHFNNDTNVYPKSVPVVVDIQTINLDKVYVEVCELSEEEYFKHKKAIQYELDIEKICKKKTSKTLEVKNNIWKLTHNKFDLEDDILGYKTNANYVLFKVFTSDKKLKDNYKYASNYIKRTNMSLFLEKAENKSLIYATSLDKTEEIEGLNLEFYSQKGSPDEKEQIKFDKVNVKYTYDKTKKVYIVDSNLSGIDFIISKNDNFYGELDEEEDSFSNYDFKYISGQDSSNKDYAYIYTDRPIYRPGDEVQIKGLVRKFDADGFKKTNYSSGILRLTGDDWQTYRTIDVKIDKNSNFTGSFVIPKDSTLGNFRFELNMKENYIYSYGSFSIEEYRKPTFKVNLETGLSDVLAGEKVNIKVAPKYYFGGKMTNTSGVYSILSQNYFFDAKDFADYQFGNGSNYFDCVYWGYCSFGDHLSSGIENFEIDENGEFSLDHTFSSKDEDIEKIYTFNFDITDPDTKKTVSNSVSKVLHTTDSYVGIKANYYNDLKTGIDFQAITLDFEAKPTANKGIKIDITKKDYKQVKKLGVDGIFYNEYSEEEKLEKSFSLITDTKGFVKYNYKPLSSGEYEIKASYTGNNAKTFVSSQTIYVAGEDYISWRNDNNTVTDLEADKITYKLGETATFTLKSPVNNGKALVVIEKDDGILDYFVHDIKSYGDKIELKLTDKHYPNVYLKTYLIGSQKDNPLPVYKRALSVVKVLTDYKKLNVSILTDKKIYKPADKMQVTIEVVDANGKVVPNANGSLSIVDESVLALKGNPKKNPYSFFYDMKRYLGVISYSNLKYLIEKLEVKDVSGGEKGGAGEEVKGGDTKKLRGNFKDTAFWMSDFTTDAKGKAIINIDVMPDNLTTWVLEALVNTPEDNKIGINYETVMTSMPIMIEDNLPRFLSAGDIITFSPVVYNRTGKDDEFIVDLKATNGTLKNIGQTIKLKNNESQKVNFVFQVKSLKDLKNNDFSKIEITAISKTDAKLQDGITKTLLLKSSGIPETTATVGKTDKISFDEKINIGNLDSNNASLTLKYGATLFSYLLDGIDYLANYPYGCAEQRTSAIMPNIYVKKLYDTAGVPFDLKTKMIKKYLGEDEGYKEISVEDVIKDYLIEISKFQNIDGGFMYWYDTDYKQSDIHLTNYMLVSLSQIKSLGYEIDKKVLEDASKYLKNEFNTKPTCNEKIWKDCISTNQKEEIILALTDSNNTDYEAYKMYKVLLSEEEKAIKEAKEKDPKYIKDVNKLEKSYLVSKLSNITTLSKTEKEDLQNQSLKLTSEVLSKDLVFNPRGAFISASSYNSRVYNTAKLLEIVGNIGLDKFSDYEAIIDSMIRFIAQSKMNNSFGSTTDNSYVIRALTSYLSKTNELKEANLFARFNFNSKEIETKKISKNNIFENFVKEITTNDIKETNTFNIEKTGSGNVYYDLSLNYFVPTKDLKARDEGFFVDKKYFNYNEYKKIETLKKEEYVKYMSSEILFENLKYPQEIVEYLKPIKSGKIGDLVLVYNKVVTNETRDQVAIESFIPSGSEIVNTKLATETKNVIELGSSLYFDRQELRDDRYFAWSSEVWPGIYDFSYTIRLTHSGNFKVKPTIISEFYNPEVFGRSEGMEFVVE